MASMELVMKFCNQKALSGIAAVLLPQILLCAGDNQDQNKAAFQNLMKMQNESIRIEESRPVTVNDAEFVLVAQTNWKPAKPSAPMPLVAPIEIQLRITNLSKNSFIFPTAKSFGMRILKPD